MSKRTRILIGVLFTTVIVLGALLFRAETKMHDYAEHVETTSRSFYFGSPAIQMQIDDLEQLKSDTGEWKSRRYLFIRNEFERQNAFVLFMLANSATDIGSNQDSLNQLANAYGAALDPIETFYIVHDSLHEVPSGGIEELQNHFRKLKSVAEKFESMNNELW